MSETPAAIAGPIGWLARALAFLGGIALLAAGFVTTVSVLLRWTTSQPIRGDFEMVSIAAGVAVFGFMGYGTLLRAHILVDSFTSWLPRRLSDWIDAFWMLVLAGVLLWLAERLALGALDTLKSGTRTIGLLALPYWWAIAIGALCFACAGAAALIWMLRLVRGAR
jgi:TRAP-type C4-dicarboxylate transport system permease small subunit